MTIQTPEQDLFLQDSRTADQQPTQLSNIFGSVPCQYIWNDAWYNLVDMDGIASNNMTFYQTEADSNGVVAYWNFCQTLAVDTDAGICPDAN